MASEVIKKFQILDPAREERRKWEDKKKERDPKRMRAAVILQCELCGRLLGPDELLFDKDTRRACNVCAKK